MKTSIGRGIWVLAVVLICAGCKQAGNAKPATFGEQSWWLISGILLLCLFQAVFIVSCLLRGRADRDLRANEERLAQLERRNELLLNSAAEGILGLDLEGKHIFVNPAAARMLGYQVEELIGRPSHSLWHHTRPDGSPYPEKDCKISASYGDGNVHRECDEVFWRKDGTSFPVQYASTPIYEQGRLLGAVVTFEDITEAKRVEDAQRASEELSRASFEQAGIGIAHVGTDGRWLRVNDKLCAIVGYPRKELMKLTFQDITHPEDLDADLEFVRQMLAGEIKTYSMQKRYLRKDRSTAWVVLTVSLVHTGAGLPLHFISIIEDITERKLAEAELLRQRAELAHVARVSTMGELAASVAHELNQPLGAILANVAAAELFLRQDPPALDDLRAILTDIRNDDARAGEVIRHMRALLSKHELERRPIEINMLVEDVFQLVSGDAALRGVSISASLVPVALKVLGDPIHLQQVLLNLILNGMDAMAAEPRERRRLSVRTRLGADSLVEFAVIDTGHGIPADKLARLFEPFFTTKPNGMGMGLSIARTIIQAHHGRIWAENNTGGGATFRITLPTMNHEPEPVVSVQQAEGRN